MRSLVTQTGDVTDQWMSLIEENALGSSQALYHYSSKSLMQTNVCPHMAPNEGEVIRFGSKQHMSHWEWPDREKSWKVALFHSRFQNKGELNTSLFLYDLRKCENVQMFFILKVRVEEIVGVTLFWKYFCDLTWSQSIKLAEAQVTAIKIRPKIFPLMIGLKMWSQNWV